MNRSAFVKILLIEDNPGDTRLIREMLTAAKGGGFALESADQLSTGLERLAEGDIDVVLLDLSLPDSQGLDTFTKVNTQAPQVPIIVLTDHNDERMAVHAVPD
jgi:DNA-binding response OmpR family regulator